MYSIWISVISNFFWRITRASQTVLIVSHSIPTCHLLFSVCSKPIAKRLCSKETHSVAKCLLQFNLRSIWSQNECSSVTLEHNFDYSFDALPVRRELFWRWGILSPHVLFNLAFVWSWSQKEMEKDTVIKKITQIVLIVNNASTVVSQNDLIAFYLKTTANDRN